MAEDKPVSHQHALQL